MTDQLNIVGSGRIIDFDEGGETCMVRLLDEDGLPRGPVITGVKFSSNIVLGNTETLSPRQAHELDTMARQNILYNSCVEVEII